MNTRRTFGLALSATLLGARGLAAEPAYPVRVSENGRYFIDQNGQPVFWLGTTQWQLFRDYALEDALLVLESPAER